MYVIAGVTMLVGALSMESVALLQGGNEISTSQSSETAVSVLTISLAEEGTVTTVMVTKASLYEVSWSGRRGKLTVAESVSEDVKNMISHDNGNTFKLIR